MQNQPRMPALLAGWICLPILSCLLAGCGNSTSNPQAQAQPAAMSSAGTDRTAAATPDSSPQKPADTAAATTSSDKPVEDVPEYRPAARPASTLAAARPATAKDDRYAEFTPARRWALVAQQSRLLTRQAGRPHHRRPIRRRAIRCGAEAGRCRPHGLCPRRARDLAAVGRPDPGNSRAADIRAAAAGVEVGIDHSREAR